VLGGKEKERPVKLNSTQESLSSTFKNLGRRSSTKGKKKGGRDRKGLISGWTHRGSGEKKKGEESKGSARSPIEFNGGGVGLSGPKCTLKRRRAWKKGDQQKALEKEELSEKLRELQFVCGAMRKREKRNETTGRFKRKRGHSSCRNEKKKTGKRLWLFTLLSEGLKTTS